MINGLLTGFEPADISMSAFKSQAASLCELAGADGVAYAVGHEGLNPVEEKTIKLLKDIVSIPLAVIIPTADRAAEKIIELRPDMVGVTTINSNTQDFITRLQVADIVTAVRTDPDIEMVRDAAKIKADYVILDATQYCKEKSLSNKLAMLDKIAKAAGLAKRLSMGTILGGPLALSDIAKFGEIEGIEEFFIGHGLAAKAVLFGLEKAIHTYKATLN